MKNCKSRGTRTPVYERNTPMPPVKPAKAEEKEKVFYLCDRRACGKCNPNCRHTTDMRHAANFTVGIAGGFWEKDDGFMMPTKFDGMEKSNDKRTDLC